MRELERLVGQRVMAYLELDEENEVCIKGTIINVDVDDFYFYEKNEPIYITVNLMSEEPLPENVDDDNLNYIPLSQIRKY